MTLFDAVALVGGSAVGGGFLAIPDVTAPLGFLPSTVGLTLTWAYFVFAGLAYVEAAGAASGEGRGASILALSRHAFGKKRATFISFIFLAQMFAVSAANLIKAAQLAGICWAMPWLPALPFGTSVWLIASTVGAFVFCSSPGLVALTNTVLTSVCWLGFLSLFATAAFVAPPTRAVITQPAEWSRLLPQPQWVVPIFANTLRFGAAVPIVVGGLGADRLNEARTAVVFGSLVPLLLAIASSLATASLATTASPGAAISVATLLKGGAPILKVPMGLIAVGAIGGSLIGALLACSQLLADVWPKLPPEIEVEVCEVGRRFFLLNTFRSNCRKFTTRNWRLVASRAVVVALPAALACLGPRLYLPLLAFSGAFPTFVLFGLLPPLAALALRRQRETGERNSGETCGIDDEAEPECALAPSFVPGGDAALMAMAAVALVLLGTNTMLALGFLESAVKTAGRF